MQDAKTISDFVYNLEYNDIPQNVIDKMKVSLLYNLSVALAGGDLANSAVNHLFELEGKKHNGANWLSANTLSLDHVVFANACFITARGQNETMYDILAHTGCVIIPSALAISEKNKVTGKEFLTALIAGYESTAAIAEGSAPKTTEIGFRSTSLYSPFGTTVSASKLLKHNELQIKTAIALTTNFNSGNTQTWIDGTDEWIFQIGMASKNGLISALIADDKKLIGSAQSLDGPKGFYKTHLQEYEFESSDWLGEEWETLNIQYKPYPGCALNQVPMYAALQMKELYKLKSNEIENLTVHLNPVEYEYPGLLERLPFTSRSGAIMSLPFAISLCVLNNHITYNLFKDYNDPKIKQFMNKVEIFSDSELKKQTVKFNVRLKNGDVIEHFFDDRKEALDFDWNKIISFVNNLSSEMKISTKELKDLINLIENIEEVDDISKLVSIIT